MRNKLINIFSNASNYITQGHHQGVLHDVGQQGTKRAPVGVGPQGAHRGAPRGVLPLPQPGTGIIHV